MPRVPAAEGPQARTAPLQGGYQQPIDVTRDQRAAAGALANVAGAIDAYQYRADQDAAFATEAALKTEWIDYESKLRDQRKGRDAATYDTEVETWWKEAGARHGKNLSPGAMRLVNRSLVTSQVQALAGAKAYKEQQLNASAESSYRAAQAVSVNEAATVGTEDAAIKALADMGQKRLEWARLQGWTPEQIKADELNSATVLHSVMVQKLMRQDPAAAQVYFDKYRGAIGAEQQVQIEGALRQVSAAVDGSATAGEVWAQLGPKADGMPVELDKMEAAARAKYPNDPTRQRAAIENIQQRAAAHNAAERERTAGKVNSVMDAYSRGTPMSRLQTMPEFMALPGAERARIQEHIADRNHALWARSLEDRARLERAAQVKAFPAFLDYSDPEKLGTMTRAQVTALLPQLGNELTGHLVQRWDAMQKPAARLEARMDQEDFNHVADSMGLRPYDPTKSEAQRQQLGELKFRLEQMVDQVQRATKAPMSREDKLDMFKNEMARKVVVDGWFGDREVPVIQLKPEEVSKVLVPPEERPKIVEALQQMYRTTGDAAYAPTEANMRRVYLQNKSRAASLLPAEK